MWPDRLSNPGPLTYESRALLTALCGQAEIARAVAVVEAHFTLETLMKVMKVEPVPLLSLPYPFPIRNNDSHLLLA